MFAFHSHTVANFCVYFKRKANRPAACRGAVQENFTRNGYFISTIFLVMDDPPAVSL